ncbi:TPA: hypothetical protein ROY01_003148 [Bacillus toyonensis]|nr:hypothetical protein [Bacillus toyonensis]
MGIVTFIYVYTKLIGIGTLRYISVVIYDRLRVVIVIIRYASIHMCSTSCRSVGLSAHSLRYISTAPYRESRSEIRGFSFAVDPPNLIASTSVNIFELNYEASTNLIALEV